MMNVVAKMMTLVKKLRLRIFSTSFLLFCLRCALQVDGQDDERGGENDDAGPEAESTHF
ncbi:MAG: hypothetical protein Q4B96_03575 [Bacillota bacterium]|nr:hypothetical protein [Bacillota bacterium]